MPLYSFPVFIRVAIPHMQINVCMVLFILILYLAAIVCQHTHFKCPFLVMFVSKAGYIARTGNNKSNNLNDFQFKFNCIETTIFAYNVFVNICFPILKSHLKYTNFC